MKKHTTLVAGLLGLVGNLLMRNAAMQATRATRGRDRTPGKHNPAGSKLARKADERSIGIRGNANTVVFNAVRFGIGARPS